MRFWNHKKFIASSLAVTIIFSFSNFLIPKAEAQQAPAGVACVSADALKKVIKGYGDIAGGLEDFVDAGALTSVPTNVAAVSSLALKGRLDRLIALTAGVANSVGPPICDPTGGVAGTAASVTNAAINVGDTTSNVAATGLALARTSGTGAAAAAGKSVAEIAAVNKAIAAIDKDLLRESAPEAFKEKNLIQVEAQHVKVAQLQAYRTQLVTKLESLKKQRDADLGDYAKAFVVGLIHDLSLKVTNNLASSLVNKFHIQNYLAYADTVANQMYSIDYIKKNFPDKQDQLIVGSLYRGIYSKIPSGVLTAQAAINAKASQYGGTACVTGAALNDPDFIFKMAKCGSTQANPGFLKIEAEQKVASTRSNAMVAAASDVSKSDYYPGRDCKDSLAQQQQIDSKAKVAADESNKWFDVYVQLQKNGGKQADIDQAKINWINANERSNSVIKGNETLLNVCTGLTNPGQLVSNFVDGLLKNQINSTSQLNNSDLPAYLVYLKNVMSDMVTNLIFGKGSAGQVLKEAGLSALGAAAPAVIGSIVNSNINGGDPITGTSLNKLIIYTVPTRVDSPKNETLIAGRTYDLVVDFSAIKGVELKQIKITGFSAGANVEVLSPADITAGKIRVPFDATSSPASFTVQASIYGESGAALVTSDSLTIKQGSGGNGGGVEPTPQPGQIIAVKYPAPNEERFKLKWNLTAVGGTAQALVVSGPNLIDSSGHGFDKLTLGRDKFTGTLDIIPPPTGSANYKFSFYQNLQDINNNVPPTAVKTYYFPEGVVQGAYTFKVRGPAAQKIR